MMNACKRELPVRGSRCLSVAVFLLMALLAYSASAVEFRVLGLGGVRDLQLEVGNRTERQTLRVAEDTLSRAYATQAGQELRIYAGGEPPAVTPEGVAAVPPLAVLQVPQGVERAILVLLPAQSAGGYPLVGAWIDDSPETRPVNSIALHNFSGEPLGVKLGESVAQLRAGEAMLHRFSSAERSVIVQAAVERSGNWERVLSRPQPVREGFRILMLLRDGQMRTELKDEVLDCLVFYDYTEPAVAR